MAELSAGTLEWLKEEKQRVHCSFYEVMHDSLLHRTVVQLSSLVKLSSLFLPFMVFIQKKII